MNFDPKKTVFLIDGSSFLYRAYYGVRPLHTPAGVPVQAVYSFVRMIKKLMDTFKPEYMAVVWDSKGKTTRHEMFEQYKATRQAPPSDIFDQKKYIVQFDDLIALKQVAQQGIEADDIMYAIAQERSKEGDTVVLITSDKDMGQAISPAIMLYDPFKEKVMDEAAFKEKMGFDKSKLVFYYALLGDTSDNIPGVKGIGDKTATDLVNQFASLEDLYGHLDKVAKERTRALLQTNKDNAFLSYNLFLLQYHATGLTKQDFAFDKKNWSKAVPLFQELNFSSLLKDIDTQQSIDQGVQQSIAQKMAHYDFITVTTPDQLLNLVSLLKQKKIFAFDTETTGLNPLTAECVGISLCMAQGTAYYVPFGHHIEAPQLSKNEVVAAFKPIFEDEQYKKIAHHASYDIKVLHNLGMTVKGLIFDTVLAAHLLVKDWQRIGLKSLSEYYFQEPMLSFSEVVKGNKYKNFSYVPFDLATRYAASDAHQTFRLKAILEKQLKEEKFDQLYYTIELPLMQVLLTMELHGIYCDAHDLQILDQKVSTELQTLEQQIVALVGSDHGAVNLNSPKQVEHLLFEVLKLPPQKKSAKGLSYSTDQEVLAVLSEMHVVPGLISKWRELAKLKSTYIEALPTYIHPHTKRIHTTFSQTQVATGRLSSSDPNLQNIPTDSQGYGIEIRAAFKPTDDEIFLSADYSQIELRILAHLSQDAQLLRAFKENRDIHKETAVLLFDVPFEQVTHEQRQVGKRINFSILYGLTPYGLAQDLKIPFKDAKQYIEKYFAQYPGVAAWMEQVVINTKHNGYVETLYKRRRYVPAIYEKNKSLYEEARRIAINTIPQGTAADIVKQGMIAIDRALAREGLGGRMLLQIHDELLLSVPKAEIAQTETLVKSILESIVSWNVPLIVTTRTGHNWKEVTK